MKPLNVFLTLFWKLLSVFTISNVRVEKKSSTQYHAGGSFVFNDDEITY